MNKKYKGFIAFIIIAIFMALIFIPSIAAAVDDQKSQSTTISKIGEISSKEEVVYGTLDSNGRLQGIYVINILDVVTAGDIIDYGEYNFIKNLTDLHKIDLKDDFMTTYSDIGKFYYQGNMKDTQLPWDIGIKYHLDGKEISAKQLAGQSGKLKMELVTHKTPIANESFYQNYMLQISITLDTEKCENIRADEAMFANSGKDKLITFTIMPNTEGHMRIDADVSDFTMEGISIAAVPFSMDIDLPDTSNIEKDLTTLSDAINALSKGANQLKNGVDSLAAGTKSLQGGSIEYQSGIEKLNKESASIMNASSTINESLNTISNMLGSEMDLSALDKLSEFPGFLESLTPSQLSGLSQLTELPQLLFGMGELAGNYSQLHEGLIAYTGGVSGLATAYGNIHSGINGIAEGTGGLDYGTRELSKGLTMLNNKTKDMPNQVSDMMDELMGDFDTSDYVPISFVSDKNENVKAVQFVLGTEPIEKEKQPVIIEPVKKETFWDRLKNLF